MRKQRQSRMFLLRYGMIIEAHSRPDRHDCVNTVAAAPLDTLGG